MFTVTSRGDDIEDFALPPSGDERAVTGTTYSRGGTFYRKGVRPLPASFRMRWSVSPPR
jgi:hypothetical protein